MFKTTLLLLLLSLIDYASCPSELHWSHFWASSCISEHHRWSFYQWPSTSITTQLSVRRTAGTLDAEKNNIKTMCNITFSTGLLYYFSVSCAVLHLSISCATSHFNIGAIITFLLLFNLIASITFNIMCNIIFIYFYKIYLTFMVIQVGNILNRMSKRNATTELHLTSLL